jgi:hypothetical protein
VVAHGKRCGSLAAKACQQKSTNKILALRSTAFGGAGVHFGV